MTTLIQQPHGIMFHHFYDGQKHPKVQGGISGDQLEQMVGWLQKNYHLLSAEAWYDKAQSKTLADRDVCLTFDDNLLCQYDIALPVLERHGIKAFWFIFTSPLLGTIEKLELYRYFRTVYFGNVEDFYRSFDEVISHSEFKATVEEKLKNLVPEKYLSEFPFYTKQDRIFRYIRDQVLGPANYNQLMDQMIAESKIDVQEISKNLWCSRDHISHLKNTGHIIGLHSHTHPTDLKVLEPELQRKEYTENQSLLAEVVDNAISTMSHPCNSYNDDTLAILKSLGIDLGFRSNMEDGYSSSLEYPRLDHALLVDKR